MWERKHQDDETFYSISKMSLSMTVCSENPNVALEGREMSEVRIVDFPATKVMVAEHLGPPELETQTALRLVRWRVANRLSVERHRSYGIHYTDPRVTPPEQHRVDFCLSIDDEPPRTPTVSSPGRFLPVAVRLYATLVRARRTPPPSGCSLNGSRQAARLPGIFPLFHYVNVGPAIPESELITDVYLPLAPDRAIQNR
jgi:AraC family transcriptional regulator